MTIKKFDKETAKFLGRSVAEALQEFAEKHGLSVVSLGGSYDDTKYVARLEFKTNDKDALAAKEKGDFELYCGLIGLKPEDYGRTFTHKNRTYTVTGVKAGTSRPLLCRRDDGGMVAFPEGAIGHFLLNKTPA